MNQEQVEMVVNYRYEFTEKEKTALAEEFTLLDENIEELEKDKKDVASDYKAKIEAKETEKAALRKKYRAGYEVRPDVCILTLVENLKERHWVSKVSGEVRHKEPFKPEDYQRKLPI